jgi:Sel1 repeat
MPSPEIPEPEPNATLRLPAGEPVNPYSTLPLDLSKHLDAGRTLKLPLGAPEPAPDSTQRLLLTRPDEAPLRVQKEDQPVETAGRTQKLPVRPAAPRPLGWKVPLGLVLLAGLAGGGVYVAFFRVRPAPPAPPPASAPRAEAIPPAALATLEQAEAGDVRAMHLLGLMYYNGLNVPQDREKGLHWLRKAAAQGSAGARAELSQIEGGR